MIWKVLVETDPDKLPDMLKNAPTIYDEEKALDVYRLTVETFPNSAVYLVRVLRSTSGRHVG